MNANTIKRTAQLGLVALLLAHSVPAAAENLSSGKQSSVTSVVKTISTKETGAHLLGRDGRENPDWASLDPTRSGQHAVIGLAAGQRRRRAGRSAH